MSTPTSLRWRRLLAALGNYGRAVARMDQLDIALVNANCADRAAAYRAAKVPAAGNYR